VSRGRLYLAGIWLKSIAFEDPEDFLAGAAAGDEAACCCGAAALGLAVATCFSRLAGSSGCLPACGALSIVGKKSLRNVLERAIGSVCMITLPYILSWSNELDQAGSSGNGGLHLLCGCLNSGQSLSPCFCAGAYGNRSHD
jgi:hypothetical protein